MHLGAGAARAGLAHLPEVVLCVAQVNVAVENADRFPEVGRLVVARDAVRRVALEYGHVQPGGVELPDFGEELPGPGDRVLFEVVAEAPVAEHLEEGVVVGVPADIVQVVVLAAGADALLRVHDPGELRLLGAEEVRLELVHPGVGEEQGGVVVRHDGAGRDEGVAALFHEEVDILLANLGRREHVEPQHVRDTAGRCE